MFTLMIKSNEMKLWWAQYGVLVGSCELSFRSRVLHFVYKCVLNQTCKNSRMHLRGWAFLFVKTSCHFCLIPLSQGKELQWTPTKYKKREKLSSMSFYPSKTLDFGLCLYITVYVCLIKVWECWPLSAVPASTNDFKAILRTMSSLKHSPKYPSIKRLWPHV